MRKRILMMLLTAGILVVTVVACSKSNAGTQDQAITTAVQNKLNADGALQGAAIKATAQNGVVTLTGTVSSDAARNAAAADAEVPGVTQVNNAIATNTPANPAAGSAMMAMQPAAQANGASAPGASSAAPTMAAAQPVEVETGTPLHVRLDGALSSANASQGQTWQGELADAVLVNGQIAIPKGAAITGTVVAADSAGHFKGQSRLVLQLESVAFNGASYNLTSHEVTRLAAARGKRSAEAIGGGAALGTLIGALAGHGKGAVIGGAAGAGAGTAAQAMTKPAEVELPAETVLKFSLSAPVQVVPSASSGN